MSSNSVTDSVLSFCRAFNGEYGVFNGVSNIIVGFSGGADSCCLLAALNMLKGEYGYSLTAVHINHGIRGAEASRDAEFCRSFCEKNSIDFKLFEVDVPAVSKETGESTEECARRLRYEIFGSLCDENGAKIATAHNANDNAETVLFNITRGSSLKGACGIPAVRGNIIRPILYVSRSMTESFCRENAIEYVTDSTNLTDDYSRNKIRHNVLPVLESINNAAVANILHFSRSAADDCDFLDTAAEAAYSSLFADNSCSATEIDNLHKSIKLRVISKAVFEFCGRICDSSKLESINEICGHGGRIQLFGSGFAENTGGVFRLFEIRNTEKINSEIYVDFSEFPVTFADFLIKAEKYTICSKKISNYVLDNLVDCDKIIGSLSVRTRRAGDEFTLGRRGVTKSVKKLFNELNIPVEQRDFLPIICDEAGVVWITGIGTAKRCRPDKNSTNIYLVEGEKYDK